MRALLLLFILPMEPPHKASRRSMSSRVCNHVLPTVDVMHPARWFEGRGDVWRLLQDLSDSIDGRTWPMQDAAEV